MANFLLGGRLGDLVHSLWVVKNTEGEHNLYITDLLSLHSDGFLFSIEKTYEDLYPIIIAQPWCKSFQILGEVQSITEDEVSIMTENRTLTNLSMWRRYAYSESWTKLLSNTFGPEPNGEAWLTVPKIDAWGDKVVIHSSPYEARRGHNWNIPLDKYEGQCVFVGNGDEWTAFGGAVPLHTPATLFEFIQIIASCKFFIGNQSAPLAMAHALGTPRLAMLNEVDKIHYVGEERWHKNFYWMAKDTFFYEGLNF